MRSGALFINVGRGSLVDEDGMRSALESGHLGAASIDVARSEPLPPEDPLWGTPRLQRSAHCSSVPDQLFVNLHELFNENVRRFIANETPINVQASP